MIGRHFMRLFERGPIRDVDSEGRSQTIGILALGSMAGIVMGAALGFLLFRWNPLIGAIVLGIPFASGIWASTEFIVRNAGVVAGQIYTPSGGSTPYLGELSQEETLIIRGLLDEAVEALEARARDHPNDPRAPLRLAELHRDETRDLVEAAAWFRRAAAVPGIGRDAQRQILRELVELCRDRLGRPELAAPALRRAADVHAGDRLGHWATSELRALREAGEA
ncbi:MAG: hypothetical protein OEU54_02575 [Gemmatimonadota bacterium]|nr:hypothetical protein [Gemmatimonadota bacterium]